MELMEQTEKELANRVKTGSWQGDLVRFDGTFRDQRLRPLSRIEIRIEHDVLGDLGSVYTDSEGRFCREMTPRGVLYLRGFIPEMDGNFTMEVDLAPDDNAQTHPFTLLLPIGHLHIVLHDSEGRALPDRTRVHIFRNGQFVESMSTVQNGRLRFKEQQPFGDYQFIVVIDGEERSAEFIHQGGSSEATLEVRLSDA